MDRVVIFDFDDTLKLHNPARQAPEALWAVQETVRHGMGIAVASASCHTEYLKEFLFEMEPEIFTKEFLASPAFQTCQKKKTGALKCTLAHHGLLSSPECAIFFDDSMSNFKYADEAKIEMIEVKKGVGVTAEKFNQGLSYLQASCPLAGSLKPRASQGGEGGEGGEGGGVNGGCDPKNDVQPPGEHGCRAQARWGKCEEPWLLEGGFCEAACGRCQGNQQRHEGDEEREEEERLGTQGPTVQSITP